LTCQSNRFVDNSGNNFTVTPTGTPSVQRFSPFIPTASYSAATVGGSGYFDGTGDYLINTSNSALAFGTGAYTAECWVYYPTAPSQQALFAGTGNFPMFEVDTNKIRYFGSTDVYGTTAIKAGQWYHFAWARSGTGANQAAAWVNGVREIQTTDTTNYAPTSLAVGGRVDGTTVTTGFISDVRVVKGTAVYSPASTTITVPTAPLTAITNTSLLCSMTNAGIIDNAMMNNLETVGNAQISTTQSKFGGSSMYFDGTGDYLISRNNYGFEFGTSDFTVEMWIRTTYGAGYIVFV